MFQHDPVPLQITLSCLPSHSPQGTRFSLHYYGYDYDYDDDDDDDYDYYYYYYYYDYDYYYYYIDLL